MERGGRSSQISVRTPQLSAMTASSRPLASSPSLLLIAILTYVTYVSCGHFYNADGTPHDPYHRLHLPYAVPPYPTYAEVPPTSFSCSRREAGYHADEETGCQAFHLCLGDELVSSHLCTNGTLFHPYFKVCDQFYNVRCGSHLEDH